MTTDDQPLVPPEPQFYRHRFGDLELIALSDGGLNYPGPMLFGNVPPEAAAQYHLPARQVFSAYTQLLVKTRDRLVLNDVGAGDLGNPGGHPFPGVDHSTSRTNLLVPSLRAAGIEPDEIDTVLITHAHPDHIGGMLDSGGNLVFPNAHYYVPRREWDYWMSAEPLAVGAEALRKHLELLIGEAKRALNAIATRVTIVQEDEEIAPGIRFEPTVGHTLGHVMVAITAGGEKAYNISDVVVHPLFVAHPEWAPAIDMEPGQADAARRQFYARATDERALVFGHHLGPFPNMGHIVKRGAAYEWQPIKQSGA